MAFATILFMEIHTIRFTIVYSEIRLSRFRMWGYIFLKFFPNILLPYYHTKCKCNYFVNHEMFLKKKKKKYKQLEGKLYTLDPCSCCNNVFVTTQGPNNPTNCVQMSYLTPCMKSLFYIPVAKDGYLALLEMKTRSERVILLTAIIFGQIAAPVPRSLCLT